MPEHPPTIRDREIFSTITIVPPVFIRLDGRSFHRLAADLALEKPFDRRFSEAMGEVSIRLVRDSDLAPLFAYTFSDEISCYFGRDLPFGGRVEKLDSITASYAASALSLALGCPGPLAFDARVVAVTPELVQEYLADRQQEAWRNHINAYCQQALVGEGMGPREAAAALKGKNSAELHEMMFVRGVNLARTPAWQRRGVLVCRELVRKQGYNPVTEKEVEVERRSVRVIEDLPLFSSPEGRELVRSLLSCP